jgi:predicted small secreted protein
MKNFELINALKLFNEKAEKLERLSFIETISKYSSGFSIKINKREDGLYDLTQERSGPLEEAIDAFVLTIRFFIQDNEATSFRNLAKLYERAPVDKEIKNDFIKIRTQLNKYLDSNSGMAIIVNEEALNHRKILDIVIYGGLSHANHEKKKRYDFLVRTPLKVMIENDFVCSLAIMFNAIKAICKLNMLVIDIFEQSDKNSEQPHNQANAADS